MVDYSELKKLAEACGNLNWRFQQENWTEYAIRDDHGYIATMRVGSPKQAGPDPDREAKAKFLGAMTPDAVLALIAENEHLTKAVALQAVHRFVGQDDQRNIDDLVAAGIRVDQERIGQLKAENERMKTLRSKTERELAQELEVWRHGPSCWNCGDTGDVHDIVGEWRGKCDCFAAQLIDATQERDQLRAENAGYKTGYEAYEQVNAGLKAEIDRLNDEYDKAWRHDLNDKKNVQALAAEVVRLSAENEALREDAELHQQIQRAAKELPFGWDITLIVEQCSGWVELTDPHGTVVEPDDLPASLATQVSMAIDAALGQGGEKQ